MKYFIPEWDDRVDPNYDFIKDESTQDRNPYENDVYAHEIYNKPPYDGILVSKVVIEANKNKLEKIKQMGIHKFLRLPKNIVVMGDCGAFGYVNEPTPPYTTDEILKYYHNLGFDYGVSIDHLIVKSIRQPKDMGGWTNHELMDDEIQKRYEMTLKNAEEFFQKHQSNGYSYIPIGAVQGWDPESYNKAVQELQDMNYEYIGIGGLTRSNTQIVLSVLRAIAPVIKKSTKLHLFGVARLDYLLEFKKLGVHSFDTASFLRQSWLGASKNYYGIDGKYYSAIRIPFAEGNKLKKILKNQNISQDTVKKMEQDCLESLRDYDQGKKDINEFISKVIKYDKLLGGGREHKEFYQKTLKEKPWKKCPCKICKEVGLEVIIFRGNNRNRRRGFHNTWVFYQKFKELLKNEGKNPMQTPLSVFNK